MKILVIDNYDSFTYNLVQLLGQYKLKVIVKRNDEITIDDITKMSPDKILISPGPGKPEDSKISIDVIKYFGNKIPVLGVCLGHQVIAIVFGGRVIRASKLMHGKTSDIYHNNSSLFKDVSQGFTAMRYHSLIVDKSGFPSVLSVTAESDDGVIMGLKHNEYNISGIQFHPESILTSEGSKIINNWLEE